MLKIITKVKKYVLGGQKMHDIVVEFHQTNEKQ